VTAHPADLNRHAGRFYGKYSGDVVEVADPHKTGRVKVSVPSVFSDGHVVWARPCFASGHFFVPPIGAKVWVEFEAGDTRLPIWVGTWYPEGEPPPEALLDPPDGRVVHTPSGHTVQFLDTEGSEKVLVRHKADSFVSIDEKGSVLAANNKGSFVYLNADAGEVTVTSEQGHMITLASAGITLAHQGGTTLEVADGKVKINAPDGIQLLGSKLTVSAGSIALGGAQAQFPVVIANPQWEAYAMHVHPTAMGPSGPPVPPYVSAVAASKAVKAMP
jgi:Type VI secretion system/phage-baseplate injector OB domain